MSKDEQSVVSSVIKETKESIEPMFASLQENDLGGKHGFALKGIIYELVNLLDNAEKKIIGALSSQKES